MALPLVKYEGCCCGFGFFAIQPRREEAQRRADDLSVKIGDDVLHLARGHLLASGFLECIGQFLRFSAVGFFCAPLGSFAARKRETREPIFRILFSTNAGHLATMLATTINVNDVLDVYFTCEEANREGPADQQGFNSPRLHSRNLARCSQFARDFNHSLQSCGPPPGLARA